MTDGLAVHKNQVRDGCSLGIANDGDELPFSVHLAILFKVYRMTLRLHSVLSLSPAALASKSARKNCPAGVLDGPSWRESRSISPSARKNRPAGVLDGMGSSMSARKLEISSN